MTCTIPEEKGIKKASDCKCYNAVMRAYNGLLEAGQPETIALDAAQIVYGFHHPEDTMHQRCLTVESWVHAEHLH